MYQDGRSKIMLDGAPLRDNILLVLFVRRQIAEREVERYVKDR